MKRLGFSLLLLGVVSLSYGQGPFVSLVGGYAYPSNNVLTKNDTALMYGLNVGYVLNKHVGFEVGVTSYPSYTLSAETASLEAEQPALGANTLIFPISTNLFGLHASIDGFLPLYKHFSLYGKLGWTVMEIGQSTLFGTTQVVSRNGWLLTGGIAVPISHGWQAGLAVRHVGVSTFSMTVPLLSVDYFFH